MPNWPEFSKIAAHLRPLWLLDYPWKLLKIGYFTVFLPFIWTILVTYATKMTKIAKKHVGSWNSCWEIIKIVICSYFQISSIFYLKPIKCRFWTQMDQCDDGKTQEDIKNVSMDLIGMKKKSGCYVYIQRKLLPFFMEWWMQFFTQSRSKRSIFSFGSFI